MEAQTTHAEPDAAAAPPPATDASAAGVPQCPNCDAALHGRYCHDCGQEQRARIQPVGALLRDGISTFLSLDFRIVPTLRRLLFAPGRLTEAYLDGRRARFTKPFRLYLLVSAVYFFAIQVIMPEAGIFFGGVLKVTGDGAAAYQRWLPRVMFVLVPGFALLAKLFYLRTRRLYAEHLVFSLHYFSFYFALSLFIELFRAIVGATGAESVAWLQVGAVTVFVFLAAGVPVIYLTLATRPVYGQSWIWSGAKATGLFLGQFALLIPLMHALEVVGVIG